MSNREHIKKIVLAGMFIAVGVAASPLSIPVGVSKCFPIQHLINVLAAVLLGPFYGVCMAFITSVIRVSLGTGSFLAFPGSMCGALLSGFAYKYSKKLFAAYAGEVIGTGIIGAGIAYPVAAFVMGNKTAALFTYVIPFGISTLGGTIIAAVVIALLNKAKVIPAIK
ncbi:MAG: energy coupling factor transporter S component ThiW [Lachnospiraceae bacterium]|nr:energy coupling factor transporter S component ThiW [Lachnospiraceae bacterium]